MLRLPLLNDEPPGLTLPPSPLTYHIPSSSPPRPTARPQARSYLARGLDAKSRKALGDVRPRLFRLLTRPFLADRGAAAAAAIGGRVARWLAFPTLLQDALDDNPDTADVDVEALMAGRPHAYARMRQAR